MANNAIQIYDGTPTEVITLSADMATSETCGGQAEWDNSTDLWPAAVATLFVTDWGADPSGGPIDLYLMKGAMGSGAEDEDAGGITYGLGIVTAANETQTAGLHYVGSFSWDVDTGAQRRAITFSTMGIKKAYFYINNQTGTTVGQPITVDVEGFTLTPSA